MDDMISRQPKQEIEFVRLMVRNDLNGRPYYSIIYRELDDDDDDDVGQEVEGYASYSLDVISDYLKKYFMPPAQSDRDIPKKPNETTDRSWGIPHRQAVCPNCDSYLGIVYFLCEGDKRKVSYCESCGQAIDWEGWEENG